VIKWAVTDYPLYFLRIINAIIFFLIAWAMINQSTESDRYGFALLLYVVFVMTTVVMSEVVIFSSDTKRDFYERITFLGFLKVIFSGLLVKASTMPHWIGSWATSLSMVRWCMQANFINLYYESDDFPSAIPIYQGFLNLYGWGGKTKWYCLGMIIIGFFIFKLLSLWSSSTSAIARKGGARFRQVVAIGSED
jgi:hypothetical protein